MIDPEPVEHLTQGPLPLFPGPLSGSDPTDDLEEAVGELVVAALDSEAQQLLERRALHRGEPTNDDLLELTGAALTHDLDITLLQQTGELLRGVFRRVEDVVDRDVGRTQILRIDRDRLVGSLVAGGVFP